MQKNPDEIIIHLAADGTAYVEIREDGQITAKHVEVDTVFHALHSNIAQTSYSTGLLPTGFLGFDLDFTSNINWVTVEIPAGYAQVRYEDTLIDNFPIPRYVFRFELEGNNRIKSAYLAIPEQGELHTGSKLLSYPFSNVYPDNRICLGNNTLPRITSMHQLKNIAYHILRLPDGDDMYDSRYNRLRMDHRELLEHLKDKTPEYYYSDILVPGNGKTLGDFIDRR